MKYFIEPTSIFTKGKDTLVYKVRKSGGLFDFNSTIIDGLSFEEARLICKDLNEKYSAGLIR